MGALTKRTALGQLELSVATAYCWGPLGGGVELTELSQQMEEETGILVHPLLSSLYGKNGRHSQ